MTTSSVIPIQFRELFSLQKAAGINQANITLQNVSMESDKYIVVREIVGKSVHVVIFDTDKPNEVMRNTVNADLALMNPSSKILALKIGNTLQLLDLEQKAQIKKHIASEEIVLLKWINEETIGIVTGEFVYHWTVAGNKDPFKVFERHCTLSNQPIVNCRSDFQGKFHFLVGISAKEQQVIGSIQLYNNESKKSQLFEGHTACFTQFKAENNSKPISLFCYAVRSKNGVGKLHIVQLSETQKRNQPYQSKTDNFHFHTDETDDFPVAIQPSKSGLLYLFTKLGYVHLFDIETGTKICNTRISDKAVLLSTELKEDDEVLCIDGSGKVISVGLDKSAIIPFILKHHKNTELALKFASRYNLDIDGLTSDNNKNDQPVAIQAHHQCQSVQQSSISNGANSGISNGTAPMPLFESTPRNVLVFKENVGRIGSVSLTVTNRETHAIYFKIKSTSSRFYSICPENGIIQPKENVEVIIKPSDDSLANLQEITTKKHKFLIMSAIVSNLAVQAENFWKGKKHFSEGVYSKKLKTKVQKTPHNQQNSEQRKGSTNKGKLSNNKKGKQMMEQKASETIEIPKADLGETSQQSEGLLEKRSKKTSPIPENLETILESDREQSQQLASPAPESFQGFELVPRVAETSNNSKGVSVQEPKVEANRSNSSVNRLYAQYSAEIALSLLEKMSARDAVQFRIELNSFLENYEAKFLGE
ncbi:hypothetical protein niasHS_002734 [Heterodera schachtii]|uniref:MSP domain-containing protein n=1 Tax=Heterodera schachtii TaxID=97005 RepID=A0ABD2K2G8_HETSC